MTWLRVHFSVALHTFGDTAEPEPGLSSFHEPAPNLFFGANAGIPGRISEFIGCSAYNGCGYTNPDTNHPINLWNDYALSKYSVLSNSIVAHEFEPPSPELSLLEVPLQNLRFVWPSGIGAFSLYSATDLTPPVTWTFVPSTPLLSKGQCSITLPIGTNARAFYRLRE